MKDIAAMRSRLIALAASAALFCSPAMAAPVWAPSQGGAVGPNVACTNVNGAAIRCIQPSVTLNDATGAAAGTSANPIYTTPAPASATGIAPVVSAALESCHVLKAAPGNLFSLGLTIQAVSGTVLVFDAVAAPVDGAVTPIWHQPVLSNGTAGGGAWRWDGSAPLKAATGLTVCFSSATTPFTKTASATAAFSGQVQ